MLILGIPRYDEFKMLCFGESNYLARYHDHIYAISSHHNLNFTWTGWSLGMYINIVYIILCVNI